VRRITWLASYPKSGNTWLRAIIDRIVRPERPFDVNALGETAPGFAGLTEKPRRARPRTGGPERQA
jgi:hypothetical protein